MNSHVVKHSVVIAGQKTSISLEDAFWKGLNEIAIGRHMTVSKLVTSIDGTRQHANLSSCLRLFVLDFYITRLAQWSSTRGAPPDVMAPPPAKSA